MNANGHNLNEAGEIRPAMQPQAFIALRPHPRYCSHGDQTPICKKTFGGII